MSETPIQTTSQLLTFRLGPEVYALDVANAREIVEHTAITQIPKTPAWIRGVVNLRGAVVPVIDLRMKFGMGETSRSTNSCVVVTEFDSQGEQAVVGVLADAALEVLEVDPTHVTPPPKMGNKISTEYIRGMGRNGDQMFVILDADRIFTFDEVDVARQLAEDMGATEAKPE